MEVKYMLVKIDNGIALDMLLDRLKFWTDDHTTYRLYEQMYENYIDGGCFEGVAFDVMEIVDNDYINWCTVIEPEDSSYDGIKKLYDRDGLGDISCDDDHNDGYSYIEAEYNGCFLVRS
jgi:hypothetical protein